MMEDKKKSQHEAGVNWKWMRAKYHFFSCIPFFSNRFLDSLTFWDWAPMVVAWISLIVSILMYFSII